MQGYKAQFYDSLEKNLRKLETELDNDNEILIRSVKNTCLFARALRDTYKDINNVAGMLAMGAACDFSPIDQK